MLVGSRSCATSGSCAWPRDLATCRAAESQRVMLCICDTLSFPLFVCDLLDAVTEFGGVGSCINGVGKGRRTMFFTARLLIHALHCC